MQIVIDISNYDYEWIKNSYNIPDELKLSIAEKIIYGTPLPKGHGRLIDVERLYHDCKSADYEIEDAIDYAPTIIEEDAESEKEE